MQGVIEYAERHLTDISHESELDSRRNLAFNMAMSVRLFSPTLLTLISLLNLAKADDVPQWIWREQASRPSPAGERGYVVYKFHLGSKVEKAVIDAAAAGALEIFVNGKSVGTSAEIRQPVKADIAAHLTGWQENTVAIFARTTADHMGVVAQLTLDFEYGKRQIISSSPDWRISLDNPKDWNQPSFDSSGWQRTVALAKLGDAPMGNVFESVSAATPASELSVPDGFKIELVRSAAQREGSWISMGKDAKGRLYVSPQNAIPESGFQKSDKWGGIWRATLDATGHVTAWEKVPVPIGDCMGMLWAYDSLYLCGNGPEGRAIYRCKDTNKDDTLDDWTLFKKIPGGQGEHGAHAMVLGPDQQLYVLCGNSTPLVEGTAKLSPFKNYEEDDVLPRIKDPVATFFDKVKTPYGYVLKTDEHGSQWQLWCGGMRNAYDFDFNEDGELFTYDSDMEWDVGLPWYRPTRLLHLVAGGEYGFREGSAKQPVYYPDTMGSAANIGLGSPTGVKFGKEAKFPEVYKEACYILDWTYGRILAVWPRPQGGSYTANLVGSKTFTEFVKGKGLPVTDLEFGNDGAMYFTVGGRGTQGGLYRVTWVGTEPDKAAIPTAPVAPEVIASAKLLREERKELEASLSGKSKLDLEQLWPKLASPEVGYAARVALEALAVSVYQAKALAETNPAIAHPALLALVRCSEKQQQNTILAAWAKLDVRNAGDYRVPQISIARFGLPNADLVKLLLSRTNLSWSESMTSEARSTHREASLLRVALQDPSVVSSLLPALQFQDKLPDVDPLVFGPQEESIYYARLLAEIPATSFEPEQRKTYFKWFPWSAKLKGGNSFSKFLQAIRQRALDKLPEPERAKEEAAYQEALVAQQSAQQAAKVTGPARTFVKPWTLAELEPALGAVKAGRNFARGKEIYTSILCAKCHLFKGDGGNVGPDLSGIGGRFAAKDILEAMIDPNKAISEQYSALIVETGETSHMGLIAAETPETLTLYADAFGETKVTIPVKDIKKREPAKTSLMPPGLLNNLQQEEILDLLAFLISGGDEASEHFKATP
jgi:putative heme-binding domain-containing protein